MKQAFDTAAAQLSDQEDGKKRLGVHRTLATGTNDEDKLPWGLYVREQDEATLNWVLPDPFAPPEGLDFRTEVRLNSKDANKILVEELFAGMAPVSRRCAMEWEDYQAPDGETAFNDLQDAIYKRFPSVLGIHIRDLFSEDGMENGRSRLAYMNKNLPHLCPTGGQPGTGRPLEGADGATSFSGSSATLDTGGLPKGPACPAGIETRTTGLLRLPAATDRHPLYSAGQPNKEFFS